MSNPWSFRLSPIPNAAALGEWMNSTRHQQTQARGVISYPDYVGWERQPDNSIDVQFLGHPGQPWDEDNITSILGGAAAGTVAQGTADIAEGQPSPRSLVRGNILGILGGMIYTIGNNAVEGQQNYTINDPNISVPSRSYDFDGHGGADEWDPSEGATPVSSENSFFEW